MRDNSRRRGVPAAAWIVVLVVGLAVGLGVPWWGGARSAARFPVAADDLAAARAALDTIAVHPLASDDGYTRDQFGPAWADVDHNGCDTRNDVLARDLTKVTFKPGTRDCVVASGTINEPYTGTVGAFARGEGAVCHQARYCSSNLQIDHVVALADAWQSGARDWPTARRVDFANDPLELLAADGPANESKGDADASGWLPANQAFDCRYVALQVAVKAKYGLTVTGAEKRAMTTVLTRCPSERLPTEPGGRG